MNIQGKAEGTIGMDQEKTELKKPARRVVLAYSVIMIFLFAVCLELILRVQQVIGPIYDLEFNDLVRLLPSDTLNHIPNPSQAFDGRKYDQFGVRQYAALEKPATCPQPIKILFVGDSFMEGYDDAHTIPSMLSRLLARDNICIEPFNVGMSSYSPAIFVPQLRKLYPIVQPDYVIIDIDETDFYDDNFRYKQLVTRDESGKNIGVKALGFYPDLMSETSDVRSQHLYITKLFKVYNGKYLKIINSVKKSAEKSKGFATIFEISNLDVAAAREKFKDELLYFKSNVEELVSVLEEYHFPLSHLIFIRHPHLNHLLNGKKGPIFNSVVFETVKGVAENKNVLIYDAAPELKALFKDQAEKYYFPEDMHLNFEGIEAYSKAVADRIRPMLAQ